MDVQGGNKAGLIAGLIIGALALVAIAIGGYLLWRHRQKKAAAANGNNQDA